MSASVVRAARQWGSRPAIIEGGHQLTYQELLEVVERAAAMAGRSGRRARRRGVLADAQLVGSPRAGPGDLACRRGELPDRPVLPGTRTATGHRAGTAGRRGDRRDVPRLRATPKRSTTCSPRPVSTTSPASCCAEPGRAGRRSTRWSRTAAASSPPTSGPTNPAWSSSLPGPPRAPRPRCTRRARCWPKPASSPMRGACPGRTSPTWRPRCSTSPACSTR